MMCSAFKTFSVLAAVLWLAMPAYAQDKIKVVASFSILGDFTKAVGGERIDLSMLAGPNSDAHVYSPTPSDARTIAAAKLVIVNGMGFEGWLPRLVKSAGNKAVIVPATKGIPPRKPKPGEAGADHGHSHSHGHSHDETDPHAWQSVANVKIYVANIRDALAAADPTGADAYRSNADAYTAKLDAFDREVRDTVAKIPEARRRVISSHDAFGYFADAYGIAFVAPQGVSTETEATARDVARIITQIRKQKIPAVFLENVSDPRLMQRIAAESGAKIGGTLFSDTLTDEKGGAPTYIDMMRHNIVALSKALAE